MLRQSVRFYPKYRSLKFSVHCTTGQKIHSTNNEFSRIKDVEKPIYLLSCLTLDQGNEKNETRPLILPVEASQDYFPRDASIYCN